MVPHQTVREERTPQSEPLRPLVGYLTGPTAVGKSDAALTLAERRGWAILSVDSRQIYRGLDIGTAKPTKAERDRVEHLLVDLLDPSQACSAGAFRRMALEALGGRQPRSVLAVGGAGLYWEALTRNLHPLPQADPSVRSRHEAILTAEGVGGLYRRLQERDPAAAARLAPNDRQRIGRALEILEITGRRMSEILDDPIDRPTEAVPVVALIRPREDLYSRIEERCRQMLDSGLVAEVRGIWESGVPPTAPGLRTVGYREFLAHIVAGSDLDGCVEEFVRNTKRYAKRQETWLRNRTRGAQFIETSSQEGSENLCSRIESALSPRAPWETDEVSP